jgi:hypothetical protein
MNIDFHTIGKISIAFIDDKNKIQNIDNSLNYYFAGKLNDILFISKEYSIDNDIITFDVDTYTEPFLAEITKRNTEIQIELGTNTNGVQTVLLRDFAFAQPRVYIEGLNPGKVNLSDYYTKGEVDSLLSNIKPDLSDYYNKEEVDGTVQQLNDLIEENYYLAADQFNTVQSKIENIQGDYYDKDTIDNKLANVKPDLSDYYNKEDIDGKVEVLERNIVDVEYTTMDMVDSLEDRVDEKFQDYYNKEEVDSMVTGGGGGATKSAPLFLYLVENANPTGVPDENGVYIMPDEKFGTEPAAEPQNFHNDYKTKPIKTVYKNISWDITDNFVIAPSDDLCFIDGQIALNNGNLFIKVELYIDDILVRHSDDILVYTYANYELPIQLTYVDYDKEITGKQLKIKVEYTSPNIISNVYVRSDYVQTYKYTDRIKTEPTGRQYMAITGLAKNIDVPAYFSDPRIYYQINSLASNVANKMSEPQRQPFYYWTDVTYAGAGLYYYMPFDYVTAQLQLSNIQNNSMIRFNTDPDSDFTYDFTTEDGWYINKPFNFERGKTYIIAAENNTIYWSEVQVK